MVAIITVFKLMIKTEEKISAGVGVGYWKEVQNTQGHRQVFNVSC